MLSKKSYTHTHWGGPTMTLLVNMLNRSYVYTAHTP